LKTLFLFPQDAAHRRPYESLLLCYREDDIPGTKKDKESDDTTQKTIEKSAVSLPDNLVIVAVPTEHSRKPCIGNLLQQYIPVSKSGEKYCLEMFARDMSRGWVSWGNEVLKFQGTEYFVASAAVGENDNGGGRRKSINEFEIQGS
jgi:N(6)-adenine-specific DNA methyltransferase